MISTINHLPSHRLAFLPTPLHPLPRLSGWLQDQGVAAEIWIKRDDQTGLALGGNKTRKLELLLGDALAHGADTLITTGAVQSNHCRQTAAAAAQAGLDCHLVLGGCPPDTPNGNLLLDLLLGATLHWTTRENRINRLHELEMELRNSGRRPYFITYGGSDPVGASGYALALDELRQQVHDNDVELDAIVVASSSGGTQAGLVAGAWQNGWNVPILGISIDAVKADLQSTVADLATGTVSHMGGHHAFTADDIHVEDGYLGGGYGVMGELEHKAIKLMAQAEGILLDPVYTGRAFGGLIDILQHDARRLQPPERPGRILFWHTGGAPALFAYTDDLR